jgi:hypothetical protein
MIGEAHFFYPMHFSEFLTNLGKECDDYRKASRSGSFQVEAVRLRELYDSMPTRFGSVLSFSPTTRGSAGLEQKW